MTNPSEPIPYASADTGMIVARAATYYRMTRYLMVAVLFGYGLWSIRDGFFRYPQENAQARAARQDILPHPGLDVPFNQLFGILLPPLAILMLVLALRKSRGEICLVNGTLSAPGHPSVPLDAVTAVDQRLWDRKGIAYVQYELTNRKGRITLDDFIYERGPIDEIHKRVTGYLVGDGEAEGSGMTNDQTGMVGEAGMGNDAPGMTNEQTRMTNDQTRMTNE